MNILLVGDQPNVSTGISKVMKSIGTALEEDNNIIYLARWVGRSGFLMEHASKFNGTIYTTRLLANRRPVVCKLGHDNEEYFEVIHNVLKDIPKEEVSPISFDNNDALGINVINPIVLKEKIDLIIIYDDLWNIIEYSKVINKISIPVIGWPAVDSEVLLNDVSDLNKYYRIFVNDENGKSILEKNNVTVPVDILPYPVDHKVFTPLDESTKLELRSKYEIGYDWFVMLSVARNIRRKNLPTLIKMLPSLIKMESPDRPIHLLLKTTAGEGPNLNKYANMLGVSDRVHILSSPTSVGVSDSEMNELYNMSDIQILLTSGEGFCFSGNMNILTNHGFKSIKNVNIGEKVLGFESANLIKGKQIAGNVREAIQIDLESGESLRLTPEHLLLTKIGLMSAEDILYDWENDSFENSLKLYKGFNNNVSFSFEHENHDVGTIRSLYGVVPYYKRIKKGNSISRMNSNELTVLAKALINGHITFPRGGIPHFVVKRVKRFGVKSKLKLTRLLWPRIRGSRIDNIPVEIFKLNKTKRNIFRRVLLTEIRKYKRDTGDLLFSTSHANYIAYLLRSLHMDTKVEPISPNTSRIKVKEHHRRHKSDLHYMELKIKSVKRVKINRPKDFYSLYTTGDHMMNLYGIPVTNCIPLAEGLSAGTMAITTKYSSPGSWGKDILVFVEPSGSYVEDKIGVERAIVDYRDAIDKVMEFYNGERVVKSDELSGFMKKNFSLDLFKSKLLTILSDIQNPNDIPLNAIKILWTRPIKEYADITTSSTMTIAPSLMWTGTSDDKFLTSSISLIWEMNKSMLADDLTYAMFDARFPINPHQISQLYGEWLSYDDPNIVIIPKIKIGDSVATGFDIVEGSAVGGDKYLMIGGLIGKGKAIKALETPKYKTDSIIVFKNNNDIKISENIQTTTEYINPDPYFMMDLSGILFAEQDYKNKLLLPGIGTIEALKLSGILSGTAMRLGKKVAVSDIYRWIYPDVGITIHTLDHLIRFCESNKVSFTTVTDASSHTVQWKLDEVYVHEGVVNNVKRVIICSKASDVGSVEGNVVVACQEVDSVYPRMRYVVGLTPEEIRDAFPNSRIDVP